MKKIITRLLLLSCLLSCSAIASDNNATHNNVNISADKDGWQLVWSDEFNYQGLPDPNKWGYEQGFIRNKEAQYYTVNRTENARVENGTLVIEARKETFPNVRYQADSEDWRANRKQAQYTAASITTLGKASWTYGKVEVRAKLPEGSGMWPAIWTLGENRKPPFGESKTGTVPWPLCGEIDIMEFVGNSPNKIHSNIHYANWETSKHDKQAGNISFDKPPVNDFHTYTAEWYEDKIKFFFDGEHFHTVDTTQTVNDAFNKPHYLLINLAIGGGWGGKINDAMLPQEYLVDYVRVYQQLAPEKGH
ncbi:glycoside hydrolase family 16 protein [Thalassotalea sp. ND16A]|uniref:glycoside hydrolase family 16 protein n=1 Tax=Thalassotalea sp. ND16A TaxID=1535422 RepID=UPI000519F550|nr:glycoside hydrolase family 16 protein [Thalassotalea sp. ND16A]KGK00115.1 Glucan endo-1,3-beta-D-glucosidase [Thalassotalea sp. ND16A]